MRSCNRVLVIFVVSSLVPGCLDGTDSVAQIERPTPESAISRPIALAPVTVSIPVVQPQPEIFDMASNPVATPHSGEAVWSSSGTKSIYHVPLLGLPIGATVTQIGARVKDTPQDGCFFAFYDQSDMQFTGPGASATAFSAASRATGTWTTLRLPNDISTVVTSGHSYSIVVYFGHFGPCWINAAEVTYVPAG